MYQAYMFDWDGTLADTLDVWVDFYHEIFAHFGTNISDREIGTKVLGSFDFASRYGLDDVDYIKAQFDKVYKRLSEGVQLNPGAKEMLIELKHQGAKLAIVTSTERIGIANTLKHFDIENLFDVIVTAEQTKKHKPDPEPLQLALAQMQAPASASAMVGDTYNDIFPAKEIAIASILYHHPGMHDKFYDLADTVKQYPPDHIVANLPDILKL